MLLARADRPGGRRTQPSCYMPNVCHARGAFRRSRVGRRRPRQLCNRLLPNPIRSSHTLDFVRNQSCSRDCGWLWISVGSRPTFPNERIDSSCRPPPAKPPLWATHWQTVALQRPVAPDAALSCANRLHAASLSLFADVPGCVVTVRSLLSRYVR